jgi:hypothetical protein
LKGITLYPPLFSLDNIFKISEASSFLINVDKCSRSLFDARETRKGRPLLTVETEVNGDSKNINERGPALVGSLGLSYRYKIFMLCLGCSSRPSKKYFFPHCTLFQLLCPHRPARAVLGRLYLSMCLC